MNWSIVGTVILALVQLVALIGAYYGLKADNAALSKDLALGLLVERSASALAHATLKEQVMGVVVSMEASIKDLMHRVATLEAGTDEWTKSLRERTHELASQMNILVLKVDRLERPDHREPNS